MTFTAGAGPMLASPALDEPSADRVILRSAGNDSDPAGMMGSIFFGSVLPGAGVGFSEPSAAMGGGALEVTGISDLDIPLKGDASDGAATRVLVEVSARSTVGRPAGSATP